jgi:hypothetical protein
MPPQASTLLAAGRAGIAGAPQSGWQIGARDAPGGWLQHRRTGRLPLFSCLQKASRDALQHLEAGVAAMVRIAALLAWGILAAGTSRGALAVEPDEHAPPPGAVVLFDGQDTSHWAKAELENGYLREGALSRDAFGSGVLHIEFMIVPDPTGKRTSGNSGVYVQRRYEIQILASHEKQQPGKGDCGAIYQVKAPDRNAARPPGQWQYFRITFRQPQWEDAKKTAPARMTVVQNGVVIHDDVEVPHKTGAGQPEGPQPGPLYLQNHGAKIYFRNIWWLPAQDSAASPTQP